MAITITKLVDGPRNVVIHAELVGANSAATLVDFSGLSGSPGEVRVDRVQWSLTGAPAELLWDATSDVQFTELSVGEGDQWYGDFGGLISTAGAGSTGDINITNGAGVSNGSVTIWCKKRSG